MKKIFDFKTAIAVIGIAIPLVIYFISKKEKEISFKNIAVSELVSEKNITDEAIEVYFDKEKVINLYSVSSIITNSGNIPVTKDDFIDMLEIKFHDSVKILKYSYNSIPSSIKLIKLSIEDSKLVLLPDLLNPNESIEFNFYLSSKSLEFLPETNSRLIGGKVLSLNIQDEIQKQAVFSNKAFANFEGLIFWISFIYTILYILLMLFAIYFQKNNEFQTQSAKFFAFLFISIGLFTNLFYLIQTWF